MLKFTRGIVCCVALWGVLGLVLPAAALAAGHGSHRGSAGGGRSHSFHSRRASSYSARRHHSRGGPLSYNAYWRAATSPNPPRTNQDYNRYWQKMQAWQEYHQRWN
jgi:hypothetical protein